MSAEVSEETMGNDSEAYHSVNTAHLAKSLDLYVIRTVPFNDQSSKMWKIRTGLMLWSETLHLPTITQANSPRMFLAFVMVHTISANFTT